MPAIATKPLPVQGRVASESLPGPRFRIGSFNIHGGKNASGNYDLGRTAECLRRANLDVVGLYEVHGRFWGPDQAAELGAELGVASIFAATERRFWHDHFGNALLTRVALQQVHRIPLPCTQGRKYRNMLLTQFRVGDRTVHLLAAHVDRVKDRDVQLRQIFALFHALEKPAVLIGDLNSLDGDSLIAELAAQGDSRHALRSCRKDWPKLRVDWIFTRGLKTVGSACVDDGSSDHPLMWVELELPQSSPADKVRRVAGK
ncbi:MAG: endonuclease/exonuclease/phosphatase family protein [Planctomycetaceae bacterium]